MSSCEQEQKVIRSFVAFRPDSSCIAKIKKKLPPLKLFLQHQKLDVRWIPADNWHVTLAFLGGLTTNNLEAVSERLCLIAPKIAPFDINFNRLNWFPSQGKPLVLACLVHPSRQLEALAGVVRKQCMSICTDMDFFHEYRGHLTIARPRTGGVKAIPDEFNCDIQTTINNFGLYTSLSGIDGVRYEKVTNFRLLG